MRTSLVTQSVQILNQPIKTSTAPAAKSFPQRILSINQAPYLSWNQRAIFYLNKGDAFLEAALPNCFIQKKLDEIGCYIENTFAPLQEFNKWLDSNGEGNWVKKLATYLVKLPMRVVRNIVSLLYSIIKLLVQAVVHPLKTLNQLAKLIVSLVYEMTQPETWTKIGAGIIGSSLGAALIPGNLLSFVGILIGSALTIAGVTIGPLKAALYAEKGHKMVAITQNVASQIASIPESLLTGLCMGLLIGRIQRAVEKYRVKHYRIKTPEEAKAYADKFIKDNRLPPNYSDVWQEADGRVVIKWYHDEYFYSKYPHLYKGLLTPEQAFFDRSAPWANDFKISLHPSSSHVEMALYCRDEYWEYFHHADLRHDFPWQWSVNYPTPKPLPQIPPFTGVIPAIHNSGKSGQGF